MLFLLTGIFCFLPEFLNILPAETVVVIENGSWQHVNKRYLEVIKWFLFFQRKHFEKVVSYFFSFSKCFEFRKHFRNRANHNYKLLCKSWANLNWYKNSFLVGIINASNYLPSEVVDAGSLTLFRSRLKTFMDFK